MAGTSKQIMLTFSNKIRLDFVTSWVHHVPARQNPSPSPSPSPSPNRGSGPCPSLALTLSLTLARAPTLARSAGSA